MPSQGKQINAQLSTLNAQRSREAEDRDSNRRKTEKTKKTGVYRKTINFLDMEVGLW